MQLGRPSSARLSQITAAINQKAILKYGLKLPGISYLLKKKLKVPHIGFNSVLRPINSKLYCATKKEIDFYFVHSYRVKEIKTNKKVGICEYGERFVASFEIENIFGTQFHPEKSDKLGLKIIDNFINI